MKEKIKTLIGFAKKSGKLSSGEGITLEQIRNKKAKLVFLAKDAGPNTEKRVSDKGAFYQIPVCRIFTRAELGQIIGQEERVVVSINDRGFADRMKELLGGDDSEYYQNISVSTRTEDQQQRITPKVIRVGRRSK